MRFIQLTKVQPVDQYHDNEEGEGLPAPAPVQVSVDAIRCFYPRRNKEPGTRLTFIDGGGFAVTESFDEVTNLVSTH